MAGAATGSGEGQGVDGELGQRLGSGCTHALPQWRVWNQGRGAEGVAAAVTGADGEDRADAVMSCHSVRLSPERSAMPT